MKTQRVLGRFAARKLAAQVGTDSAMIYAIAPEMLWHIIEKGEWKRAVDEEGWAEADEKLKRIIRQHGGAVFMTGADGNWDVSINSDNAPMERVHGYGYIKPYGTDKFRDWLKKKVALRYVQAQSTYYHVTYLKNLSNIAREGLVPGRPSNFGPGYSGYSQGKLFFSDAGSVRFWAIRLGDLADNESDNPIEDGLIPVPLKVDLRADIYSDEIGTRDSQGRSIYITQQIPPTIIHVFDGRRWLPITSANFRNMGDRALAAADVESDGDETYTYPDYEVFVP